MGYFSDILGTLRSTFKIGKTTLDASAQTAPRTHTLPDKSGTVAMLSDVVGGGGNVIIQSTPPTPPGGTYMWIQTQVGKTGHGFSFWIEDGT